MNIIKNLIPMNKRQWCWMTSINRSWPTSATIYCYLHISNNIPFTKPIGIHFSSVVGVCSPLASCTEPTINSDWSRRRLLFRTSKLSRRSSAMLNWSSNGRETLQVHMLMRYIHSIKINKKEKRIDYIMPNILYQFSIFRGSKSHRRTFPPHIKELDFK